MKIANLFEVRGADYLTGRQIIIDGRWSPGEADRHLAALEGRP